MLSRISVAIVNFNTRDYLRACLASIPQEAQVAVFDNASSDGSAEMVRKEFPGVKLYASGSNLGYGRAANELVAQAETEYVLVLNSDTRLEPGALERLRQYLDQHPSAGVAAPRLANEDGSLQPSCCPFPGTLQWALDNDLTAALLRHAPGIRNRLLRPWPHTTERVVPWIKGAALAIRKTAFEAVGGFDPSLFMYFEDTDLCYRLASAGWEVRFAPVATVTHSGAASTDQCRAEMLVHLVEGNLSFCRRRYSGIRVAFLSLLWRSIVLCRYIRDRILLPGADETGRIRLAEQLTAWRRLLSPYRERGRRVLVGHPPEARGLSDPQTRPANLDHPSTTKAAAKLRLLVLLPFPPRTDGAHGGSRVMAQFVKRLGAAHHVAILYLRASEEPDIEEELRNVCESAECILRPSAGRTVAERCRWYLRLLAAVVRGRPMWVAGWRVGRYAERVRELAEAWRPDIVDVEYHIMGQYLPCLDGCPAPRVLTVHEPGTAAARDRWQAHQGLRRALLARDRHAWERFERETLARASTVVVFTETDRRSIAPLAGLTPVRVIPPGGTDDCGPLRAVGSEPAIVFVGGFRHPPNVDAAERILRGIFPLVLGRNPDALAYVVGERPPRSIRRAANRRHVVVTGWVADVTSYLDRAAVVVAPLRLGGGMRVKVLEALAAGKAVVATRLAAAGLDVVDGEHIIFAESDAEFAESIVELLSDPNKRSRLGSNARSWASTHLDWGNRMEAFEALYRELIGSNGGWSGTRVCRLPERDEMIVEQDS